MDNENSVAFIAKINKIEPIIGADKLELATINGWTSVVQKGIHTEGFLVLCITTDAVIPEDLAIKWGVIEYLRKRSRVRTVKLRGVYSECILIPINDLSNKVVEYHEGKDLMETLGIFKYEPPIKDINLNSNVKKVYFKWKEIHKFKMWKSWLNYITRKRSKKIKENPNFEVYYKFPNQKNVPHMFQEGDEVVITRKLHGTNARYSISKKNKLSLKDKWKMKTGNIWAGYEFCLGSHNVQKISESGGFYSTDVWKEIAKKYDIEKQLWSIVKLSTPKEVGSGITIYGEIYGPGIQKNYDYNEIELKLTLFDIQVDGEYLSHFDYSRLIQSFKLPCVETLYIGNWSKEIQDNYVFNNFVEGTKIPHEGVVVKCITGNRRKLNKVINPEYLTYGEKNGTTDSH